MSTTLYYKNKDSLLVWIVPPKIQSLWHLFNQAFKEANKASDQYFTQGWTSDMTSSDFSGFNRLHGEEGLERIKGCEINFFMNSVKKHSRNRTEKTNVF